MIFILPPPRLRPAGQRGEILFGQTGCASCHIPTVRTGPNAIPALDQVEAHLYSDLLLHDMGSELADNRADGLANGQEWRTSPLWGLRLAPDALGGQATYLHDGRATSLDESIRLHGGESAASRDGFNALGESDRTALIAFLESL